MPVYRLLEDGTNKRLLEDGSTFRSIELNIFDLDTAPCRSTARCVATGLILFYYAAPVRASAVAQPALFSSGPMLFTPTTLALTLTTYAPTVTAVGTASVVPTTTALTISTFAPTVTAIGTASVIPTTTALVLTTYAPTVTAIGTASVTPTTASLSLNTYAPTVTAIGTASVIPTTAALTITTYAPTVTMGVSAVPIGGGKLRASARLKTTGMVLVSYATPVKVQARVQAATVIKWGEKYIRAHARLVATSLTLVYYATPIKAQARLKNAQAFIAAGRFNPTATPVRATALLQPALLGLYVDVGPIFVQAVVQPAVITWALPVIPFASTPIRAAVRLLPALLRRIYQTGPIRVQAVVRSAVLHPQWRGRIRIHPRLTGALLEQKSVLRGTVCVQARVKNALLVGDLQPSATPVRIQARVLSATLTIDTHRVDLIATPIRITARLRTGVPLGYPPGIPAPIRVQARCLNAELGKHGFALLRGRCVATVRLKGASIRRIYQTAPIRIQARVVTAGLPIPRPAGFIYAHARVMPAVLTIIPRLTTDLGTGWCRGGARLICIPFTLTVIPLPPTPGTGGRENYTGRWPMFSGFRWSEEVLGRYLRKKT